MHQLVYISSAREELTDEDIDQILTSSRKNNGRDGITGVLIYDGKRFLQALEGDMTLVEPAFLRIDRDPRHTSVNVLSVANVDTRQFGSWEMAGHRVAPAPDGLSLEETVDALAANLSDKNMRALFNGFASTNSG